MRHYTEIKSATTSGSCGFFFVFFLICIIIIALNKNRKAFITERFTNID